MIAVSAIFALTAIAICAVQFGMLLDETRADLKTMTQHVALVTIPQLDQDAQAAHVLLQQSTLVTQNANRRISDTSQNLNAILIQAGLAADQVQQASREQKKYWENISGDTDKALKSLNAGARGLDQNMSDLHALLADPHLKDALAQSDAILADAHEMTTDAKGVVKRYSKPPTRKQRIIQTAKDVGGLTYLIVKIAASLP